MWGSLKHQPEEKAGVKVLLGSVMLAALTSCGVEPCDFKRITRLIHKDIRDEKRSPTEFVMEQPRRDGRFVYVGMAQKLNPLYRYHYWVDPKQCRIAKVLIDQ